MKFKKKKRKKKEKRTETFAPGSREKTTVFFFLLLATECQGVLTQTAWKYVRESRECELLFWPTSSICTKKCIWCKGNLADSPGLIAVVQNDSQVLIIYFQACQ